MFAIFLLLAPLFVAVPVRERPREPVKSSSWVGKTIFMRASGVRVDLSAEPNELNPNPPNSVPANAIQYRVFGERLNHVQIKTREGQSGWLRKTDVILLEDAIPFFTKQIQANPSDSATYSRRASAYRSKGELDLALKDASEALRLNPHAANYNNRALVWTAKKNYDQAIADYAKAIELVPQYALAHVNRASMWHAKKDNDKAIADTSAALQWEPKNPTAYRIRGISWLGKKEYDKAIEDLSRSLELDAKSSQTHVDRAEAHARKKQHVKALDDFEAALRLEPTNGTAMAAFALWLASCPEVKFRDGKRALELALKAHQQNKSETRAIEALAAACAELGRFEDAVKWAEHALFDPALRDDTEARQRLEAYRKQKPYRAE